VITGSANWTGEAWSTNVEHGVVLEGPPDETVLAEVQTFFENLWNSGNAKIVGPEALAVYRGYWKRLQRAEQKVARRTTELWSRLQTVLPSHESGLTDRWPDRDIAYLLGALAARGHIDSDTGTISIELRYGGERVQYYGVPGMIGKGQVSFFLSDVAAVAREALHQRISRALPFANVNTQQTGEWTWEIVIDCARIPEAIEDLRAFFDNATSYMRFPIPKQVMGGDAELQKEFLRGYAAACALVSSGTYTNDTTQQVWLRPQRNNSAQFEQLKEILSNLGITRVYIHRRPAGESREPHVKVLCQDWMRVGFGIEPLDEIVREGARMNGALP